MWRLRGGLELRVELNSNEPRMVSKFDYLREHVVRRCSRKYETGLLKLFTEGIVYLESMPVSLADLRFAINFASLGALFECARVGSQAHGATLDVDTLLALHDVDNGA